jgi:hypothetical protein
MMSEGADIDRFIDTHIPVRVFYILLLHQRNLSYISLLLEAFKGSQHLLDIGIQTSHLWPKRPDPSIEGEGGKEDIKALLCGYRPTADWANPGVSNGSHSFNQSIAWRGVARCGVPVERNLSS